MQLLSAFIVIFKHGVMSLVNVFTVTPGSKAPRSAEAGITVDMKIPTPRQPPVQRVILPKKVGVDEPIQSFEA